MFSLQASDCLCSVLFSIIAVPCKMLVKVRAAGVSESSASWTDKPLTADPMLFGLYVDLNWLALLLQHLCFTSNKTQQNTN